MIDIRLACLCLQAVLIRRFEQQRGIDIATGHFALRTLSGSGLRCTAELLPVLPEPLLHDLHTGINQLTGCGIGVGHRTPGPFASHIKPHVHGFDPVGSAARIIALPREPVHIGSGIGHIVCNFLVLHGIGQRLARSHDRVDDVFRRRGVLSGGDLDIRPDVCLGLVDLKPERLLKTVEHGSQL